MANNELNYKAVAKLNKADHFRGDAEFEAKGVFEAAARPRIKAAMTGMKPNGQPIPGKYLDGRSFADGFAENVEFFAIAYLDGAEVEFGLHFARHPPTAVAPCRRVGAREAIDPTAPRAAGRITLRHLVRPIRMPGLLAGLAERADVTHVSIVADLAATYAQLAAELPEHLVTVRLYRDYLEAVRSATR